MRDKNDLIPMAAVMIAQGIAAGPGGDAMKGEALANRAWHIAEKVVARGQELGHIPKDLDADEDPDKEEQE